MSLSRWEPVFTSPKLFDPSMHFEADLVCPLCGKIVQVKTDGYKFLPPLMNLSHRIENGIKGIAKTRVCPHCGVVFGLTENDTNELSKEITRQITPDFIEERLKELKGK